MFVGKQLYFIVIKFRIKNLGKYFTRKIWLKKLNDRMSNWFSGWFPYGEGTEWCTTDGRKILEWFTDITLQRCQSLCVQQKGPNCRAVEYWSGQIFACFQCTDPSKVEPYTNANDLAYPVHVWVRGKNTLRIPPHERSCVCGEGEEGMRDEPE